MKNKTLSIRKIVTYLNNDEHDGGYWLPNIQRPFVWNEEQIERLFDSIMREYPISTLLVWKTKSQIRCRKFIDNYKTSFKLSDYFIPENSKSKMLILDGQQRLQSLFIGLKGSYEGKELYIDILSGDIIEPDDIKFKFKFLEKKNVKYNHIKLKDIVFSNKKSRDLRKDILNKVADEEEFSDENSQKVEDNIDQILDVFKEAENIFFQEIDSIDNPERYSDDDIVEIFIRANSGGTKLGKSDLLFSLLSSSWEEAETKMEDLLEDLNKSETYNFTRDFILKTCLVLLEKGARYDVSKFRDGSTKEKVIENWDEISSAIKDVRDFLYSHTFIHSDKALLSYLMLIPLIYFRYKYPKQWSNVKNVDQYIVRSLVSGAFGSHSDNIVDKIVSKIEETKKFDKDDIFSVIREDGKSLEISEKTILESSYNSKLIHLLFNLWYAEFNYKPSFKSNLPQVDHIFPQSLLKKEKILNPENGKNNITKYKKEDRDQIANCMLLTASENGAGGKSDTPPEEWFSDKDDQYLEKHLIPKDPNLWKIENFEDFIDARKELILGKFKDILQKKRTGNENDA